MIGPGDRIEVSGIKLSVLVGAYPSERTGPQTVFMDLCLPIDTEKAARNDSLNDTIDYRELSEHLLEQVKTTEFVLLETLGDFLAKLIHKRHGVDWVRIHLFKPNFVPLADKAMVVIERVFHS